MKNIKMLLAVIGLSVFMAVAASAQAVNLTALDGSKVNVTGQNGKVVILAVGATWLPLSKDQVVIANKLAKKYSGRDVVVYFVATDSSNAKSKNFADDAEIQAWGVKNKVATPVLRDSDGLLTLKKFGVDQLPSFVIIDKTGKQSGEPFGGIDPATDITPMISKAIDRIL